MKRPLPSALCLLALVLASACGQTPDVREDAGAHEADSGQPDASTQPQPDASVPGDGGSCQTPCAVGTSRCAGTGAQQCVSLGGCAIWTDVITCGASETCHDGRCQTCECTVGTKRCGTTGPQTCEGSSPSCGQWKAGAACATSQQCREGECVSCAGTSGTTSNLTLQVNGEARFYWLHVPPTYQCGQSWPLLIDFHGTASAPDPATSVEEYYALDGLMTAANAQGVIVARPRSRYASVDGTLVFQWDVNPGDLARNKAFALALVAALKTTFNIDPARVWASGFSNGTNMASQFLADSPPVFQGYAVMAGGLWDPPAPRAFTADAPRIYATTGFRDYMHDTFKDLRAYLSTNSHPAARQWIRESDTGHELYGWQFREAMAYLDTGARPAAGTLRMGWAKETLTSAESVLALAAAPSGEVLAGGTSGTLWLRSAAGAWSSTAQLSGAAGTPNFTDICLLPGGEGIAVGDRQVAVYSPTTGWALGASVPDFGMMFGPPGAAVVAVGCGANAIYAGGYWIGAQASSPTGSWQDIPFYSGFGQFRSQVAAVAVSSAGTAVAVGYYNYIGASQAGGAFAAKTPPLSAVEWFTDVAWQPSGRWWVVGEAGAILASTDDATSFKAQVSGTKEDLYSVAFVTAQRGLAVGAHGAAVYTNNGGASWSDVTTGLDVMLADVVWLDGQTALVVGERGTALRFSAP